MVKQAALQLEDPHSVAHVGYLHPEQYVKKGRLRENCTRGLNNISHYYHHRWMVKSSGGQNRAKSFSPV